MLRWQFTRLSVHVHVQEDVGSPWVITEIPFCPSHIAEVVYGRALVGCVSVGEGDDLHAVPEHDVGVDLVATLRELEVPTHPSAVVDA